MSYDLNFWRCKPGVKLIHQHVYEHLSDGLEVEGTEEIPAASILARVVEEFCSWENVGINMFDGGDNGFFEVMLTRQLFRVDCRGMKDNEMNKLVRIAQEFKLPLFDPQIEKRFDAAGD